MKWIALLFLGQVCVAAPPLNVVVSNHSQAPGRVLTPAIEFAQRAFESAGIETTWTLCHPDREFANCSRPLPVEGLYVTMLLMPKMVAAPSGPPAAPDLAGFALVGRQAAAQPRAWAFLAAMETVAEKTRRPISLVLGCVLVHEIAHVLGLSHRDSGIMVASLTAREFDEAAAGKPFDSLQARQLSAGARRLVAPVFVAKAGK